jgi:hypothetical protein
MVLRLVLLGFVLGWPGACAARTSRVHAHGPSTAVVVSSARAARGRPNSSRPIWLLRVVTMLVLSTGLVLSTLVLSAGWYGCAARSVARPITGTSSRTSSMTKAPDSSGPDEPLHETKAHAERPRGGCGPSLGEPGYECSPAEECVAGCCVAGPLARSRTSAAGDAPKPPDRMLGVHFDVEPDRIPPGTDMIIDWNPHAVVLLHSRFLDLRIVQTAGGSFTRVACLLENTGRFVLREEATARFAAPGVASVSLSPFAADYGEFHDVGMSVRYLSIGR